MGNRFRSDLQGGDLFVTMIAAFAMIVFSLGIAFPWALVKIQRLYLNALALEGEVDLKAMEASRDKGASALSDGISDAGEVVDAVADFL